MNHVELSGPYDFSALDWDRVQVSVSFLCVILFNFVVSVLFLLELNKGFVINDFIFLCNYATKIFWDDICEYYFPHSPLSDIYISLALFHVTICFILPVWVPVLFHVITWLILLVWIHVFLHETSVTAHPI